MIRKIVFKQGRAGVGAKPRAVPQPFLYPEGRFGAEQPGEDGFWICVRTRPRWEKKFVVWMMERHRTCFLPVFPHETASGRKRRTSLLPLFPGFVAAFLGGVGIHFGDAAGQPGFELGAGVGLGVTDRTLCELHSVCGWEFAGAVGDLDGFGQVDLTQP